VRAQRESLTGDLGWPVRVGEEREKGEDGAAGRWGQRVREREKERCALWQNQPELYQLKYASPIQRASTCFKRYNPLACRVASR
jgi:hypothetical protein